MQVSLRAMAPAEWEGFERRALQTYAATLATPHGSSPEWARRRAEDEHARLVPDGLATPGHFFFVIEAPPGQRVGTLWFAERTEDGTPYAYLYDIEIDETCRGGGIGRAALAALEDEARQRGLAWIDLSVSGPNQVARGLYAKLGYQDTFVQMRKRLA